MHTSTCPLPQKEKLIAGSCDLSLAQVEKKFNLSIFLVCMPSGFADGAFAHKKSQLLNIFDGL
jgi:hypothetical protein